MIYREYIFQFIVNTLSGIASSFVIYFIGIKPIKQKLDILSKKKIKSLEFISDSYESRIASVKKDIEYLTKKIDDCEYFDNNNPLEDNNYEKKLLRKNDLQERRNQLYLTLEEITKNYLKSLTNLNL